MAESQPPNPVFRWVVVVGALFAFTAMSMFASSLGHPQAPPNRFFNAYGIPLILVETVALVVVSFIAMAVDQRQSRNPGPSGNEQPTSDAASEGSTADSGEQQVE